MACRDINYNIDLDTRDASASFFDSPKEASTMNNGNADTAADVMKGRGTENSDDASNNNCKNSRSDDKNNGNAEASVSGKKRSRSSLESSSNKEDEDNAKATKEHVLEFKWETYNEDDDNEGYEDDNCNNILMFDDEIRGDSLGISRAVCENTEGENHEYSLTICLVDGKSEDRRILAEINVDFWTEGINLMEFNQKSQDLADFCRSLWSASGRNISHYSDMDIELGRSRHSGVEIKELVEEATDKVFSDDIIYIRTAKLTQGSTANESLELLNRLFAKVGVFVIAHRTDLEKLGLHSIVDESSLFNFIGDGWFAIETCREF